MNSSSETPNPQPSPPSLDTFLQPPPASGSDGALEQLSEQAEDRAWKIRAERFCWITLTISLVDMDVFTHMSTWAGPICVFAIQLGVIVVLARHYGIREIILVIDRVVAGWGARAKERNE